MLCITTKFWAWDNTMSLDDESTIAHPKPRYQLGSNTESFESISLSSRSSWQYHQAFTMPPSSSITPTRNSSSSYTTSTVHQNPFEGVNRWGSPAVAPTFTPSPYIPLHVITYTPILTVPLGDDALPTPWRTQMWVQVEDNKKGKSWGTLSSS